jgi:hypothetical protein
MSSHAMISSLFPAIFVSSCFFSETRLLEASSVTLSSLDSQSKYLFWGSGCFLWLFVPVMKWKVAFSATVSFSSSSRVCCLFLVSFLTRLFYRYSKHQRRWFLGCLDAKVTPFFYDWEEETENLKFLEKNRLYSSPWVFLRCFVCYLFLNKCNFSPSC